MKKTLTDNEKYEMLMAKYKENRREDGEKANKYLVAAMKLQEKGDVDHDTFIGMAYL